MESLILQTLAAAVVTVLVILIVACIGHKFGGDDEPPAGMP